MHVLSSQRETTTSANLEATGGSTRTLPSWAALVAWLIAAVSFLPLPARATDGCLVLLCLAAPSWSSIAQCVDPVRSVLNDMAHGRPFPSCSMSGNGNQAGNQMAVAPSFCPPQYSHEEDLESGAVYTCDYTGAVNVDINGALWSRTWWNLGGDSVTEFTDTAKAQLGSWDTRFDDDYARWLAAQPAPAQNNDSQGG